MPNKKIDRKKKMKNLHFMGPIFPLSNLGFLQNKVPHIHGQFAAPVLLVKLRLRSPV
jgi:hypothetical protein